MAKKAAKPKKRVVGKTKKTAKSGKKAAKAKAKAKTAKKKAVKSKVKTKPTAKKKVKSKAKIKTSEKKPAKSSFAHKMVYYFGGGKAEGYGKGKYLLGGKGSGLADMSAAKVPVPPGFTITTPWRIKSGI